MSKLLGYDPMNEAFLYDTGYFRSRQDNRREEAYLLDSEKIKSRKPGRVLDIGGGNGEFGAYFGEYWNFDPFTGNHCLPAFKVDVVVFRGTLQHIHNPVEMLDTAKQYLRDGGLLAILATPDTDSLGYWRWGTLPALDRKRNWIPFGHRMLVNILERLSFRDIEVEHPYGQPYARPLANLFNFLAGKPDAFPGNMMDCFAWK